MAKRDWPTACAFGWIKRNLSDMKVSIGSQKNKDFGELDMSHPRARTGAVKSFVCTGAVDVCETQNQKMAIFCRKNVRDKQRATTRYDSKFE